MLERDTVPADTGCRRGQWRRWAGLLLVAALGVGCAGVWRRAPEPHVAHAPISTDERAAVAWLQASQHEGFTRHDLDAYLAVWAPEATLTVARGPEPGPHDRTLDHDQLVETRRERFFRPPQGTPKLWWTDVTVAWSAADRMQIAWVAHSETQDGGERVAERYELRRSRPGEPVGFRVVSNRLWPLWIIDGRRLPVAYDAPTWAHLDRVAAETVCFGGPCPSALLAAWRFEDAYAAARRETEGLDEAKVTAQVAAERWALRGVCAVVAGHVEDAEPSFAQALRRWPQIELPPWRSAAAARAALTATGAASPR